MAKKDKKYSAQEDDLREERDGNFDESEKEEVTEKETPHVQASEDSDVQHQEQKDKIVELEDLIKRQAADFNNFRKRVQEDKERIKDAGQESMLLDLLPVFDNIERAFESCMSPNASLEGVKVGLEGIMALFMDFLYRWNIQRVDSMGQPFDPKIHEALFKQEGDYEQQEVIQEVERAYKRNERVIRTAKVGVGVPKQEEHK